MLPNRKPAHSAFRLRTAVALAMAVSLYAIAASAQGIRYDNVVQTSTTVSSGQTVTSPAAGVTITACSTAPIVAVSEVGAVVTATTSVAHGLVAGQPIQIAGVANPSYSGTFTVATTPTSTSFTYINTAATGLTSSSGGTVLPNNVPCTPLANVYADQSLTTTASNPTTSDALGNYGFWLAPGTYVFSLSGGAVSPSFYPVTAQPGAVDTVSNQTIGGNKTFTGNLTLQGTVLASGPFTLSNPCAIDGMLYVSTAGCYTTISSAKAALAGKSGVIVIPPGYTETFPTAIALGDGVTQSVYLHAYAPVTLTCNVSSGPCLTVNDASSMDCIKGGFSLASGPSLNTTCMLVAAATASFTDVITTGTGLIDYLIEGWTVSNLLGGTKSGALLHLAGGGGRNLDHVSHMDLIWPSTGIGLLQDVGTTILDTVEVEGDFSTGVRPCVVKPPSSTPIQDTRWIAVTCEHPGVGQRALEINGNGVTNGVQGFRCFGCRIEGTTSADTTGQALIRDAVSVAFYSPYCATPGGNLSNPYCFEISQSGAGLTDDVAIYDAFNASPASTNLVTNLITSRNFNFHQGSYRYGSSATGTRIDGVLIVDGGLSFANPLMLNTAPTISSGFGTSPSIVFSNGSAVFQINVGTGGVATSGVLGLPTATNGWGCLVQDMNTNIVTRATAFTTTSVTLTAASAWTASDKLTVQCEAF
jgi:hypothetical protein